MILSHADLLNALESNLRIVPKPQLGAVGPTSIDLKLHKIILKYHGTVDLLTPRLNVEYIDISGGYTLNPDDFVVGQTLEVVTIPHTLQAFIETRGRIARAGLQIHGADGHVDPGFVGNITLEIKNLNTVPVVIYPDIYICQLYLHTLMSECSKPYSGVYMNQSRPTTFTQESQ